MGGGVLRVVGGAGGRAGACVRVLQCGAAQHPRLSLTVGWPEPFEVHVQMYTCSQLAAAAAAVLPHSPPSNKTLSLPGKALQQLVVKPETALIRPFVVAAVLRGVTLDASRYNSFIDLQVGGCCMCVCVWGGGCCAWVVVVPAPSVLC